MGLAVYPWQEELARELVSFRDNLPNGLLVYGPRGIGTIDLVVAYAKSLFCEQIFQRLILTLWFATQDKVHTGRNQFTSLQRCSVCKSADIKTMLYHALKMESKTVRCHTGVPGFSFPFLHRKDKSPIRPAALVHVRFRTFQYTSCHNSFVLIHSLYSSRIADRNNAFISYSVNFLIFLLYQL